MRSALLGAGLIDSISVSCVARLLSEVDLRPQRFKMWIHSPDPLFRPKVTEFCALYTKAPAAGEVIVCVDEKTGMHCKLAQPMPNPDAEVLSAQAAPA